MSRFSVGLATAEDDAELRRLLRENPMAGRISLSFEREPNVFLAAGIEGDDHCTLVVRAGERIVAMGSWCTYRAWVNGEVRRIGYLSQLRLDRSVRGDGAILARGFAAFQQHARKTDVPFFVTTIIADNAPALRFLATPKPGFPLYVERGTLHTLALPLHRLPKLAIPGVEVRPASAADLPVLVELLGEHGRRHQFTPAWDAETLQSETRCRGLRTEDFLIAWENEQAIGCVALWDQSPFKQTVVRGYAPWLGRVRPLANLLAPWLGIIRLPPLGRPFSHASLSHLAARSPKALALLVAQACLRARAAGHDYVTVGFGAHHAGCETIRRGFRHFAYTSRIFSVHPDREKDAYFLSEDLPAHLESAVL